MTNDKYDLDLIDSSVTVNFFCEYPCKDCDKKTPDVCTACYPAAPERILFNDDCRVDCPAGRVKTIYNECEFC